LQVFSGSTLAVERLEGMNRAEAQVHLGVNDRPDQLFLRLELGKQRPVKDLRPAVPVEVNGLQRIEEDEYGAPVLV
jgi:hypothetical protein